MNPTIRQRIREKIAHVRAERLYLRLHPDASEFCCLTAECDLRHLLAFRNDPSATLYTTADLFD